MFDGEFYLFYSCVCFVVVEKKICARLDTQTFMFFILKFELFIYLFIHSFVFLSLKNSSATTTTKTCAVFERLKSR